MTWTHFVVLIFESPREYIYRGLKQKQQQQLHYYYHRRLFLIINKNNKQICSEIFIACCIICILSLCLLRLPSNIDADKNCRVGTFGLFILSSGRTQLYRFPDENSFRVIRGDELARNARSVLN